MEFNIFGKKIIVKYENETIFINNEKDISNFFLITSLYKINKLNLNNKLIIYNQEELEKGIYENLNYNRLLYPTGEHINIHKLPLDKNLPYQVFFYNPINGEQIFINSDLVSIKTYSNIYVHSPYIINLSYGTNIDILINCLKYGALSNCKGVVVHCGKCKGKDKKECIINMINCVRNILFYINPICPLLIETPAGQKGEVGDTIEELSYIYNSINSPNVKICVDTCHVFAAGYDPLEYLKSINKDCVKLVHFNDSKKPIGSHLDRHQIIGQGYIGIKKLILISNYCTYHNIPFLRE